MKSAENTADLCSLEVPTLQLLETRTNGPEFLSLAEKRWPMTGISNHPSRHRFRRVAWWQHCGHVRPCPFSTGTRHRFQCSGRWYGWWHSRDSRLWWNLSDRWVANWAVKWIQICCHPQGAPNPNSTVRVLHCMFTKQRCQKINTDDWIFSL